MKQCKEQCCVNCTESMNNCILVGACSAKDCSQKEAQIDGLCDLWTDTCSLANPIEEIEVYTIIKVGKTYIVKTKMDDEQHSFNTIEEISQFIERRNYEMQG